MSDEKRKNDEKKRIECLPLLQLTINWESTFIDDTQQNKYKQTNYVIHLLLLYESISQQLTNLQAQH